MCIYFILDNELICYPTREVRRVNEAFNRVHTLERVWGTPPVWARWSPLAENGYRAFQRAKMSPLDTQLNTISCIFLLKIKLNTVTPLKKILKLVFKTDYHLMHVKSITESSPSQCFWPAWRYHSSLSVLSIFERPLKIGFTVTKDLYLLRQVVRTCVFAYT